MSGQRSRHSLRAPRVVGVLRKTVRMMVGGGTARAHSVEIRRWYVLLAFGGHVERLAISSDSVAWMCRQKAARVGDAARKAVR